MSSSLCLFRSRSNVLRALLLYHHTSCGEPKVAFTHINVPLSVLESGTFSYPSVADPEIIQIRLDSVLNRQGCAQKIALLPDPLLQATVIEQFHIVPAVSIIREIRRGLIFEQYPDLLSVEEVCEALRMGYNAVYELLIERKRYL